MRTKQTWTKCNAFYCRLCSIIIISRERQCVFDVSNWIWVRVRSSRKTNANDETKRRAWKNEINEWNNSSLWLLCVSLIIRLGRALIRSVGYYTCSVLIFSVFLSISFYPILFAIFSSVCTKRVRIHFASHFSQCNAKPLQMRICDELFLAFIEINWCCLCHSCQPNAHAANTHDNLPLSELSPPKINSKFCKTCSRENKPLENKYIFKQILRQSYRYIATLLSVSHGARFCRACIIVLSLNHTTHVVALRIYLSQFA